MRGQTTTERPVAIDLFSGAGGLSLGLEQAGFDVLAAVDIDPLHALAYRHNFPKTTVVCDDVAALSAQSLRAAAARGAQSLGRAWDGEVDCIAGGPSCQGFSSIGTRDPADPRNSLVLEFARLVAEVRPRYFILENVPGLLSAPYKILLDRLLRQLREAGYDLGDSPWTLDAYDFGVPQRRRRIFIVGARNGVPLPARPVLERHVSAAEAIADLATLSRFPASSGADTMVLSAEELQAFESAGSAYARTLRAEPDGDDHSAPRTWNRSLLTGVACTTHRQDVRLRFEKMRPGERDVISRLPKLDAAKPSPTLRAGTGRDHGSFTSVRPVHYASPRVITVREAARLHSFPDWFRFHATRWHALRQIGNSVPPYLARAVGAAMVSATGQIPTRRPVHDLGDPGELTLSLVEAAELLNVPGSRLPSPRRKSQQQDSTPS